VTIDQPQIEDIPMTNVADARATARKFANQTDAADLSSDAQEVKENIRDLGNAVGNMASRQYGRAQDGATDAVHETEGVIRRNPLAAIGIGLGLGFLFGLFKGRR
jgi:ElaB/YqjD/DUF883 family membrane-anchored ribosome-binding protein